MGQRFALWLDLVPWALSNKGKGVCRKSGASTKYVQLHSGTGTKSMQKHRPMSFDGNLHLAFGAYAGLDKVLYAGQRMRPWISATSTQRSSRRFCRS
jgi:hypothetical protein